MGCSVVRNCDYVLLYAITSCDPYIIYCLEPQRSFVETFSLVEGRVSHNNSEHSVTYSTAYELYLS